MNDRASPDNAWLAFRRIYWTLAGAMAIALVLLTVLGFGPGGRQCKAVAAKASADGATTVAVSSPSVERFACGAGSRSTT